MENPEKPPLFASWKGWYLLVLAVLVAEIFFFYLITKAFQ
jgi:hypothetical protein